MNDAEIRGSFHRTRLRKYHVARNTLVLDELGLKHGACRADIAVINGRLIGYEIKSDEDSLYRLGEQIEAYNDVFDRVTVVVGSKHAETISSQVPDWWGIIVSHRGPRGGILFETVRGTRINRESDLIAIAQLLWRNEATDILAELGMPTRILRKRREVLYEELVNLLGPAELRHRVRDCLKNRRNWRCPTPPSSGDGSSLLSAK